MMKKAPQRHVHYLRHRVVAAVVAMIIFVALLLLAVTRAATPGASIEAENGSFQSISIKTESAASGGKYVQFSGGATDPSNPLAGRKLFVNPNSAAKRQANQWRTSRPADAALMDKLAAMPNSLWVTTDGQVNEVPGWLQAAKNQGAITSIVVYNLPKRDCGQYSAGGSANEGTYKAMIDKLVTFVGNYTTIIILEPDGLPQMTCLGGADQAARYRMLNYAVDRLEGASAAAVYIDAGNSGWVPAGDMIPRLKNAGIAKASGFALNTSNFKAQNEILGFGRSISAGVNGKHFVVDTSRNGLGAYTNQAQPAYNWCNPPGRALGHYPTTSTNTALVDAFLYVKEPGDSDGADPDYNKCFGGPSAGTWWPEYALGLIKRWPAQYQP